MRKERFAPCPDSPNCVSSQQSGTDHFVSPIAVSGDTASVMNQLESSLTAIPRTTVTERDGNYLRAQTASRVFGFVDDLEFLYDESASALHVRSASRTGYWDFGVNRRRVEALRQELEKATGNTVP